MTSHLARGWAMALLESVRTVLDSDGRITCKQLASVFADVVASISSEASRASLLGGWQEGELVGMHARLLNSVTNGLLPLRQGLPSTTQPAASRRLQVCRDFVSGACTRDSCRFAHVGASGRRQQQRQPGGGFPALPSSASPSGAGGRG